VHLAQLLDPLVVREDIEVVVPSLPEGTLGEPARDRDLQRLYRGCKRTFLMGWLGYEKVNVLWHDYESQHLESIALAGQFQRQQKPILGMRRAEIGFAAVATEGEKVVFTFMLITLQAQWHDGIVSTTPTSGDNTARYGAPYSFRVSVRHKFATSGSSGCD
jgi:hypothetical protein